MFSCTSIPQRIDELETKWKIFFVPHPSDRSINQLHNITLVAMATEENNNTVITCNEFEYPDDFFPTGFKSENLTVIGKGLMKSYNICLLLDGQVS